MAAAGNQILGSHQLGYAWPKNSVKKQKHKAKLSRKIVFQYLAFKLTITFILVTEDNTIKMKELSTSAKQNPWAFYYDITADKMTKIDELSASAIC